MSRRDKTSENGRDREVPCPLAIRARPYLFLRPTSIKSLSRDGRIEHQREPAVSPKLEDTGKDEVPTRYSSLPFYRTPSG